VTALGHHARHRRRRNAVDRDRGLVAADRRRRTPGHQAHTRVLDDHVADAVAHSVKVDAEQIPVGGDSVRDRDVAENRVVDGPVVSRSDAGRPVHLPDILVRSQALRQHVDGDVRRVESESALALGAANPDRVAADRPVVAVEVQVEVDPFGPAAGDGCGIDGHGRDLGTDVELVHRHLAVGDVVGTRRLRSLEPHGVDAGVAGHVDVRPVPDFGGRRGRDGQDLQAVDGNDEGIVTAAIEMAERQALGFGVRYAEVELEARPVLHRLVLLR